MAIVKTKSVAAAAVWPAVLPAVVKLVVEPVAIELVAAMLAVALAVELAAEPVVELGLVAADPQLRQLGQTWYSTDCRSVARPMNCVYSNHY